MHLLFADLVLINGKIVYFNEGISFAEAVAVKHGKIVKIGRTAEIKQLAGPETTILDVKGKVVLPGFIDTHTHPEMYGEFMLFEVDCSKAKSISDIVGMIKEKAKQTEKGMWIRAYGYDDHRLAEKRHPTRRDLDKAAPDNPVALRRVCGHMAVFNTLALKVIGITKETANPEGGIIDREPESGEPTGLLRETAADVAWKAIPKYTVKEIKQGLKRTFQDLLSWGITTIHDISAFPESIQAYQELKAEGELPVRVNLVVQHEYLGKDLLSNILKLGIRTGFGDEWLKIIGVKFYADGSIGGHTAALNEPYIGEPQNFGVLTMEKNVLNRRVAKAHGGGLQVCIHAIGDRAVDVALDAIERALKENPRRDHRHRIEHCGVCTPKQLKRLKNLGVCVSASTCFISGVGEASIRALGEERINWYYPHKSLAEYGIVVSENSDLGASMSADPFIGIYTSTTRKDGAGKVFGSNQSISLEEAIRSYTINAAFVGFDEKSRGSIEEGKLADLIVLSDDPFSVPTEHLKDVKVDITIVNGEIKFRRKK